MTPAALPRPTDPLLPEVRAHDAAMRAAGLTLWVGAEPTFTRADSQEPEWLTHAEGGDKRERAQALLESLLTELRVPAARRVDAPGRHFPGEPAPRFALGALWPRTGDTLPDAPPPAGPMADPALAWLTVTPDPGVVEVNLPPSPDLEHLLPLARATFRAAHAAGLSPERLRFNGEATDSGGGGQLTLGGPSPETSPFFLHPQLLPGVLRYLQRHPSLSYAFAPECVGSASQGPRPDEGVRERFEELGVTLERLEARGPALTPEELWTSLAPLLVDAAGNSHRAEVNVEKLWNPLLTPRERGLAGLVEFRALRMQRTPERLVALAALLRAVCARVLMSPPRGPLVEWGPALHERFALPHYLEHDLSEVLEDLAAHGVGLGPRLSAALLARAPALATVELAGAVLEVREALEFWPLVGDVASQEQRTARLVDASTRRLEVRVRVPHRAALADPAGRVGADGWAVPLQECGEGLWVGAVRYRAFAPRPGFHPGLAPHDPLTLTWTRAGCPPVVLGLHGWRPDGGGYPGLPADAAEAQARRAARVVRRTPGPDAGAPPCPAPRGRADSCTLDLRRLPAGPAPRTHTP